MEDTTPTETEAIETGLEHLQKIEAELEEIKERTANPQRSFYTGILYGAGALIGGIIGLIIIGWLLSLLGIVPGFGSLAAYLHNVVDRFNTHY